MWSFQHVMMDMEIPFFSNIVKHNMFHKLNLNYGFDPVLCPIHKSSEQYYWPKRPEDMFTLLFKNKVLL